MAEEDIAAIIEADLHRTGQFAPVSRDDMLSRPQQASEVYYRDWRALNVDYLIIGQVPPTTKGLVAHYEMFDVYTQKKVLSA